MTLTMLKRGKSYSLTMKQGPKIPGMVERFGWKLLVKLEKSDRLCRQKCRDGALEYLVSKDSLSYSPKGNYEVTVLDNSEDLVNSSKEKVYYFRLEENAKSYAKLKYASKDKNSPEYGKLPSGVGTRRAQPASV